MAEALNVDKLFHMKSASLQPVFLNTSIQNGLQASFKRIGMQNQATQADDPVGPDSAHKTIISDSQTQTNNTVQSQATVALVDNSWTNMISPPFPLAN